MSGKKSGAFLIQVATMVLIALLGTRSASAQLGTRTVFVDPSNGVDSPEQSGGTDAPFASITYAMQQLEDAEIEKPWTLRLQAGTYAAPAETFPIVLHTGMQLIGDDDIAPLSVVISGTDNTNKNAPLAIANGATNVTLSGITFRDNARTGGSNQGGALELISFGGTIQDCQFIGNSTRKAGGAVWASLAEDSSLPFESVLFEDNKVEWYQSPLISGGAIHVSGNYRGSIMNCNFSENKARNEEGSSDGAPRAAGGAIYVGGDLSGGIFSDNNFTGNQAAPYLNNLFTSASSGGAIHIEGNASTTFARNVFELNSAFGFWSSGGAIAIGGTLEAPDGEGFQNCRFSQNLARTSGGAISIGVNARVSIYNTPFSDNVVYGFQQLLISGGAIHVTANYIGSIINCGFTGNRARNEEGTTNGALRAAGGAIFVGGDLSGGYFADSTFTGNRTAPYGENLLTSASSGAALYVEGDATTSFDNCDFYDNSAFGFTSTGGAVSVRGALQSPDGEGFRNCEFRRNLARTSGGALYIGLGARASIYDTPFTENVVTSFQQPLVSGGAIHVAGSLSGSISGSSFVGNKARNEEGSSNGAPRAAGGAIYVGVDLVGGTISNTTFTENQSAPYLDNLLTSVSSGGAIHIEGDATTYFDGCEFFGNDALGYFATGGAIAIAGIFNATAGTGIQACLFAENNSHGPGGAVFAAKSWTGDILNSDFVRNKGLGSHYTESGESLGGALAVLGGMQGDITGNLFSDNLLIRSQSDVKSLGGAIGIGGTYLGAIENNTFTANQAVGGRNSWSEGGAIGIRGLVQQIGRIENNLFGKNSANYGGGLYLGADSGAHAKIFNNHFLYNQTPDRTTGGAAVFTRQNMFIYNNTILGQAADVAGIALWDLAGGTEIRNNGIINVRTGVHLNSATLTNSVIIAHNNFFNTTDIVLRGTEGLGNSVTGVGSVLGNKFFGNHTQSPRILGEGGDADRPNQTGSWKLAAYYDLTHDVTVFTDPAQNWTPGQWKNTMLNLSQSATNANVREHFLIADNSSTEIMVRGNLAPEFDGKIDENRGLLAQTYTIDNYHSASRSPNIDRGAPVNVFIGNASTDITPETDYEGDFRPRNCGVDIGADEGLRPVAATLTLEGDTSMCLGVGADYIEPGVMAESDNGLDIEALVTIDGTVDTRTPGVYTIIYTLDFCTEPVITRMRTVNVSLTPCNGTSNPVANAGANRTVTPDENGSTTVQLDGSGSTGTDLSFIWTGLNGAPDPADTAMPTVNLTEGLYTFQLTVMDNNGQSDSDQVVITVLGSNVSSPVADAGQDQTVSANENGTAVVSLDGRGSTGTGLTFEWSGLNGAPGPDNTAMPTVTLAVGTYQFQLTVTDGNALSDLDSVMVTVLQIGSGTAPTAVAIAELTQEIQSPNVLATVLLKGSSSFATEATIASFTWVGLNGAPDPADIADTTVQLEPGDYMFGLTVTDSNGLTDATTLSVSVERPAIRTIRILLSAGFAVADSNEDGALSLEEARSLVPYLRDTEFSSLDENQDGTLEESELSVGPDKVVGCSGGDGPVGSRAIGDIMVVLGTLALLVGCAGVSSRIKKQEDLVITANQA